MNQWIVAGIVAVALVAGYFGVFGGTRLLDRPKLLVPRPYLPDGMEWAEAKFREMEQRVRRLELNNEDQWKALRWCTMKEGNPYDQAAMEQSDILGQTRGPSLVKDQPPTQGA